MKTALLVLLIALTPLLAKAQHARVDSLWEDGEYLVLEGEFDPGIDRVKLDHIDLDFEVSNTRLLLPLGDVQHVWVGELRLYKGSSVTSMTMYQWLEVIRSHQTRLQSDWQVTPPYWDVEYWFRAVVLLPSKNVAPKVHASPHNIVGWRSAPFEKDIASTPDLNVYYRGEGGAGVDDARVRLMASGTSPGEIALQVTVEPPSVFWEKRYRTHSPSDSGFAALPIVPLNIVLHFDTTGMILSGRDSASTEFASAQTSWDSVRPEFRLFPHSVPRSQNKPSLLALIISDDYLLPANAIVRNAIGQQLSVQNVSQLAVGMYFLTDRNGRPIRRLLKQ